MNIGVSRASSTSGACRVPGLRPMLPISPRSIMDCLLTLSPFELSLLACTCDLAAGYCPVSFTSFAGDGPARLRCTRSRLRQRLRRVTVLGNAGCAWILDQRNAKIALKRVITDAKHAAGRPLVALTAMDDEPHVSARP